MAVGHLHVSLPSLKGACDPVEYLDREEKIKAELKSRIGEVTRKTNKGLVIELSRESGIDPKVFTHNDVEYSGLFNWKGSKLDLVEAVASNEKRGDSRHWREIVVALPKELTDQQRQELAASFSQDLCDKYHFAAYGVIHCPPAEANNNNYHLHLLTTTREVTGEGRALGAKLRDFDNKYKSGEIITDIRQLWEHKTNQALKDAGREERIDLRSLVDQGIDRAPREHAGPKLTAIMRGDQLIDEGFAESIQEMSHVIKRTIENVSENRELGSDIRADLQRCDTASERLQKHDGDADEDPDKSGGGQESRTALADEAEEVARRNEAESQKQQQEIERTLREHLRLTDHACEQSRREREARKRDDAKRTVEQDRITADAVRDINQRSDERKQNIRSTADRIGKQVDDLSGKYGQAIGRHTYASRLGRAIENAGGKLSRLGQEMERKGVELAALCRRTISGIGEKITKLIIHITKIKEQQYGIGTTTGIDNGFKCQVLPARAGDRGNLRNDRPTPGEHRQDGSERDTKRGIEHPVDDDKDIRRMHEDVRTERDNIQEGEGGSRGDTNKITGGGKGYKNQHRKQQYDSESLQDDSGKLSDHLSEQLDNSHDPDGSSGGVRRSRNVCNMDINGESGEQTDTDQGGRMGSVLCGGDSHSKGNNGRVLQRNTKETVSPSPTKQKQVSNIVAALAAGKKPKLGNAPDYFGKVFKEGTEKREAQAAKEAAEKAAEEKQKQEAEGRRLQAAAERQKQEKLKEQIKQAQQNSRGRSI